MTQVLTSLRSGNTALITGGASGIGLAVAQLCYAKGMNIVVADNNKDHLSQACRNIGEDDKLDNVSVFEMDVGNIADWQRLKDWFTEKFSRLDLLMLNAGIGIKGGWENTEYFQKVLNVNLFGQIYGLNAFLPMIQSQQADIPSTIVLTGSKQGITNPPSNPAYNASKAAVKTLAEHLAFDMRGSNTTVHFLVPGWTFTGLSGGHPGTTQEKPAGAWMPAQVAQKLEEAIRHKEFWVICPDNDVTEDMDRRRMMWAAGDAIYGRPPLSRWREDFKDEAAEWMKVNRV